MKHLSRLILVLPLLLLACTQGAASNSPVDSAYSNLSVPAINNLRISTPYSIPLWGQYQIVVTGGIPPYTYTNEGGQGAVAPNGMFSAYGTNSTVAVLIQDSSGLSQTILINVGTGGGDVGTGDGGGITGGGGTISATNCGNILGDTGNYALEDATVSGYGSIMNAANTNNPTDCAMWCGSIGAGYCEWVASSSPICLAWPSGTMMTSYQSSVTVYAGSCY